MDSLGRQLSFVPKPPSLDRASKPKSNASKTSQQSRNPFQASVSGPPRYIPRPDSPAMNTSPLMKGSRIPRKSPGSPIATPGHMGSLTASQRPAKAQIAHGNTSKGLGSAMLQKPNRVSLANPYKPLPSPPALQLMCPSSPPKAQRTLIDAEVIGTPSTEEWPVLSPDNTASEGAAGNQIVDTANAAAYSHTSPSCASIREQHEQINGTSDRPVTVLSAIRHDCNAGMVSSSLEDKRQAFFEEDFTPETTVHALTTPDDEALDSPLAYKVAIPPRISSKRTSLPLSVMLQESQMVTAAATAASRRREAKVGDIKWPLLKKEDGNASDSTGPHSEPVKTNRTGGKQSMRSTTDVSKSMETYQTASSPHAYSDLASYWSHAACSSTYDDETRVENLGYRTKRLSDHSSKSEPGPVLKISDDADAVLLGRIGPPMPDMAASKSMLKRESLSTITSRTMSRLSIGQSRPNRSRTIERKISHSGALTACKDIRLPMRAEFRQSSTSPQTTTSQESKLTVRKRSPVISPKSAMVESTCIDQPLAVRSGLVTASRPKASPAAVRLSSPSSRAGASPSYARSTIASTGDASISDQRATLRKPANSSIQPNESKPERSDTGSKNDSKTSRGKETQRVDGNKVTKKLSIRNMLQFRDTKQKPPPVPVVPKRSSLIEGPFRGRFRSLANLPNQKAGEESTCRTAPQRKRSLSPTQTGNYQVASLTIPASNVAGTQNNSPVPSSSTDSNPGVATTRGAVSAINSIVNHVSLLPETSSDRLRGLSIAEALLACLDACKHAQIAATQARQSARQAELDAQRSAIELGRLFTFGEQDLDKDTVQMMKDLLKNAWDIAFPTSSSATLHSTSEPKVNG